MALAEEIYLTLTSERRHENLDSDNLKLFKANVNWKQNVCVFNNATGTLISGQDYFADPLKHELSVVASSFFASINLINLNSKSKPPVTEQIENEEDYSFLGVTTRS